MKKYTITEKEYKEMVDAMNTLSSENNKLRGFIDGMREQLLINDVVGSYESNPYADLCKLRKETYEEYKIRKGITNVHEASILLGLDAVSIIGKQLREADRLIRLKSK